jgi:hypothetical protein
MKCSPKLKKAQDNLFRLSWAFLYKKNTGSEIRTQVTNV